MDTDGTGTGSDGEWHRLRARVDDRRGSAARPRPRRARDPGASAPAAPPARDVGGPAAPRAGAAGATPGRHRSRRPRCRRCRRAGCPAGSAGGRRAVDAVEPVAPPGVPGPRRRGRAGAEEVRPRRAGASCTSPWCPGRGARPDLLDHVDRLVDTLLAPRRRAVVFAMSWSRSSCGGAQAFIGSSGCADFWCATWRLSNRMARAGVRVGRVEGLIHQFGRLRR